MTNEQWMTDYVRLVQHDLSAEAFTGFQLAFLRTMAVPHLAEVLAASGPMRTDAERRAYTTGLMMYEVIEGRLESPRARRVIKKINRAHAGLPSTSSDFSYVMDAFIVVPTRHMDRMGWRKTTTSERVATWRFYCRLSELMNISNPPASFEHAVERFDRYENENVRPSLATIELGALTLEVLQNRLPRLVKPLGARLFAAQLDAPHVAEALGMPAASSSLRRLVRVASALDGRRKAKQRATDAFFTPGQPAGRCYANGYSLEELLAN